MGDKSSGGETRPALATWVNVGDDDVLLGRGKRSYNHEGNCRFRKLVLERAAAYRANENKAFRKAMAHEVISIIARNGGKFLRPIAYKTDSGDLLSRWQSVPFSVARTKVKQALRDMASGLSLQQSQKADDKTAFKETGVPLQPSLLSPNPLFHDPLRGNLPIGSLSQFPAMPYREMHLPLAPASLTQPNAACTRLLQMALLQQKIQENEQRALMLQVLDQERSTQLAQLSRQQGSWDLSEGRTPQERELLRGLNPVSSQMDLVSNPLFNGHDSQGSAMMHFPAMSPGLFPGLVPAASRSQSTFPPVASAANVAQSLQLAETMPTLAFAHLPVGGIDGSSGAVIDQKQGELLSDTYVSTPGKAKDQEGDSSDDQSEP